MLSVSTRIRYGLRALVRLAQADRREFIPLVHISEQEQISRKYLENIFNLLKHGEIVKGTRGPDGGYQLSKSPDDITVLDIVNALEGPLSPSKCVTDPMRCENTGDCGTRTFWKELQEEVECFLKSKTLTELVSQVQRGEENGSTKCLYG